MRNFKIEDTNGINLKTAGTYVADDINIETNNENITPENIKKGKTILGVTGTLEGAELPPYDINYFYPAKFYWYNGTQEEFDKLVKAGGDKHLYKDMNSMFDHCTSLTSIPLIDTANVINMSYMFQSCSNLTTIPLIDTAKVINMYAMFSSCSKLTTIPLIDTANVTNMSSMFSYCSNLTTIPLIDTANVTYMNAMFYYCSKLTTIPLIDTANVTDMNSMFNNCSSLTEINMININANLDIHWSTLMQQPALHKLIDNLVQQPEGKTKTLTLGSELLPRVSEEYKTKAQQKGWTLA